MEFINIASFEGITITKKKVIDTGKGNVMHALKESDDTFSSFGEAYFSSVDKDQIKGWKKHNEMLMNIVVPVGGIKFFFVDDKEEYYTTLVINDKNYSCVTIEPKIWVAFKGLSNNNLLLNIASIEHDPSESEVVQLEYFNVKEL